MNTDEKRDGFFLRLSQIEDIPQIINIMQTAYDCLDNKDLFVVDSPEWVEEVLTNPERGFGVVGVDEDNDEVVSYFIVEYPGGNNPDNYGFDIGFDFEQREKVANMDTTAVLPKARGHHLEARMVGFAESHIDKKYIYYMGTVSPDNPASCKAAEANGYKCVLTKEKYGGKMRRIYLKTVDK